MKLQVTQQNLNKALASVARIANARNSLPILSNVLLKVEDNRLSVAATNLDIAITHYIGAKVESSGAITVPARLTQDFIASVPDGVLELELTDNKLSITTDKYQSTINGTSADDYPVMPAINKGTQWSVSSKIFKKALQQVIFSASSDETRPVLTGVFIHTIKNELFMTATDSYRLAEKKLQKSTEEIKLLIPASTLHDMLRIMDGSDDEIKITHDEQQAVFIVGDVTLVTRLIDGNYPDYQRLIPAKFSTTAVLKKDDFANITKVSSLFARESAGSITLEVSSKTKQVSIHAIASQLGENTASAVAEVNGGGDVTLNSRYLLDALSVIDGDTVEFCFNGKLEPCVVKGTGATDYTHIVMPLRS